MTRHETGWLWAAAGIALGLALWVGICYAQSGLSVPGDLGVTDDITIGDDLTVGDDATMSGTTSLNHHSSSYLPQRTLIMFNEALSTGKAFPDTICGMASRLFFYAPCDGLLYDVYFGVEAIGSGWDSLLVDVFAGVSTDTSVFTVLPQMTPAAGTEAETGTSGRAAQMSATMRELDAGERVEVWALIYGSCADGPTGLTVYGWFQPDYGN